MKMSSRGLSFFLTGAAFVAFAFLYFNCQPSGGLDPDQSGGAGGNDKGGSGGSEKGGSGGKGSGGSEETGGNGGGDDTGGKGSGGKGSGGKGSGGENSGGKGGSGDKSGGTTGSGGVVGNGGSSATGNGGTTTVTTTTSPKGTSVTINKGKGEGAMVGYGWVSLGSKDSVSDPKCGTAEITSATNCASTTWSTDNSLCVTGAIPVLSASPTEAEYNANWGISVGLNATEPAGSGLGQTFSTVAITVKGSPTSGLRAQIHKKGDPDGTSYCITLASGSPLTLTKFAIDCYETTPAKTFPAADIPNIDKVAVQIYSGNTAITVKDLCITKIEFAK